MFTIQPPLAEAEVSRVVAVEAAVVRAMVATIVVVMVAVVKVAVLVEMAAAAGVVTHYGSKQHLMIYFPTSTGVSEQASK